MGDNERLEVHPRLVGEEEGDGEKDRLGTGICMEGEKHCFPGTDDRVGEGEGEGEPVQHQPPPPHLWPPRHQAQSPLLLLHSQRPRWARDTSFLTKHFLLYIGGKTADKVEIAFNKFDLDNDGYLSWEEFQQVSLASYYCLALAEIQLCSDWTGE